MSLTRRGLFGVVARAAAAVGLAKIAAAMPEVPTAPAAAPFRGTFTFPEGQFVTTSMTCVITMKDWTRHWYGPAVRADIRPIRKPETLAERVRRHVAESRETRWRARTPARLFWGLP